jgi:hypothetical protein
MVAGGRGRYHGSAYGFGKELDMGVRLLVGTVLTALPSLLHAQAAYDVVVYGGTSAGVAAAVQASRIGKSVVLIEPTKHLGGLTASGLGYTDSGDKAVIGGISREFYQRVKKHYDRPSAWMFEKPTDYKGYRANEDAIWTFEPKVAERIFNEMLAERNVPVVFGERLLRKDRTGVAKQGSAIQSIRMESGRVFAGKIFIDATYEGDLMAEAGVSFTVGREANAAYGETLNGVQVEANTHSHRFTKKVSPYVEPNNPMSGLLPNVEAGPIPKDGEADKRLQAFCFRMCLTQDPRNRKPFEKPADYDEREYELFLRNFEAGDLRIPMKPDAVPNHKTDVNNNCAVSTDFIGRNWDYPEASYERRAEIIAEHLRYQQGLMWTLLNHPRVPESVRTKMKDWGLSADEFTETGGWPHQIYVREARRMIGAYVHTELDCRRKRQPPTPVGMGSYNMDSHNCTRFVTKEGYVQNEGDVQVSPGGPYQISYDSLTPKKSDCTNLLVPVCLSSSHIAYGSIRMEPVFMVLGQSAATAAALAIDAGETVQDIDRNALTKRLLAEGQVLSRPARSSGQELDLKKLDGIVIDDSQAELVGFTSVSQSVRPFIGDGYRHDGGRTEEPQRAIFRAKLNGRYEVRIAYTPNPNRRKSVPVRIISADGRKEFLVNQREKPRHPPFQSLGVFTFNGEAVVEISNDAQVEDLGHVVVDAAQFLPVKETK